MRPIHPILECVVEEGHGHYRAYFGYINDNAAAVAIAVGSGNKFSPHPIDRGQPTLFLPGRTPHYPNAVFSAVFDGPGLVWVLAGPDGSTHSSTASFVSARCVTPVPTATPTNVAIVSPRLTPTETPTALATDTPTNTAAAPPFTVTPTAALVVTPAPTNAPTAVATDTPPPPSATATDSATPTATATSPPGVVIGIVFDDGTAQSLEGALARAVSDQSPASVTNHDGTYTLPPLPPGETLIEITTPGYTRNLRRVAVTSHGATRARDARLTALAVPAAIGPDGGTITADGRRASGVGSEASVSPIELIIPATSFQSPVAVTLTALSPQGLILPVPLGWSVLLGVDVVARASLPASATLRVPTALLTTAGTQPITVTVWDDATQQWRGGAPPTLNANSLDVTISDLPSAISQFALLVADTLPAAPPAAVEGAPLVGVDPLPANGDSGLVVADPPAIITGSDGSAIVAVQVHSVAPLPSGTLLEGALRESYDLRDGSEVLGTSSRQDLVGYQLSPARKAQPLTPSSLRAYFALVPSRDYALSELAQGRVDIDIALPPAGSDTNLIDEHGGDVLGPGGVRLVVPPNAVNGPTAISLSPVAPAALPHAPGCAGGACDPPIAAFQLTVSGAFDALAAYRLSFGTSLADGQSFLVGRLSLDTPPSGALGTSGGGARFVLVALGHSENGLIAVDACPAGIGFCLEGLTGNAIYSVFALPAGIALVTGVVADGSGPRAGVAVVSDQVPVIGITDASGRYVLPAPIGVLSTITSHDHEDDLSGSVSVTPVCPFIPSNPGTGCIEGPAPGILSRDIELLASGPEVIAIDPPNHASTVALGAIITVTFSKPIAPASLTDTSVQLLRSAESPITSTTPAVVVRRSLSSDGSQLLITPNDTLTPNTLYRLNLSTAITDLHGSPLTANTVTPNSVFMSDFTTALTYRADALPPNTLRVSLPTDDQGANLGVGQIGRSFVCGGAQLAAPGTTVVVIEDATGLTLTATATDRNGVSGSDVCDALFPGRCDTTQPGSFCAVLDATVADRIRVQVHDALGNTVTLDSGNMRDERTGATAIDAVGGVAIYPPDPRFTAIVPPGAFAIPTIVQIVALPAVAFPVTTGPALELVAGVILEFDGTAAKRLDITVPASSDATADDQFIVTQHINFRSRDELTMVDTAHLDGGAGLVISDFSGFGGIVTSGVLGVQRAGDCLGYVTGFVSVADYANTYIGGGLPGALLPFPILQNDIARFAVPIPCNRPVAVNLNTLDDQLIMSTTVTVAKGVYLELPLPLSDDTKAPKVEGSSLPDGAAQVNPGEHPSVAFNEPLDPASVTDKTVRVFDSQHRQVKGRLQLSPDGRVITFVPTIRLRFGEQYRFEVNGVSDKGGNALAGGFSSQFAVFVPQLLRHITDVDARDVALVDTVTLSGQAGHRLLAVAEGDGVHLDFERGVTVYDVTDLDSAPPIVASAATAGIDRAVQVVSGPGFSSAQGTLYPGPFLMSVDGPGAHDRFGAWRLFQLSPDQAGGLHLDEIAVRVLNHSADTYDFFNNTDPSGPPPAPYLKFIPNDVGVPEDVISFDTQVAYVANAPNIGIQAIALPDMNTDELAGPQVDGTLTGLYRAVARLKNHLLTVQQDGAKNVLVLADPQLALPSHQPLVTGTYPLPPGRHPVAVTALPNWPTRITTTNAQGVTTTSLQPRDLAVVMCQNGQNNAVCVVPVNVAAGGFDLSMLPQGAGVLAMPSGTIPLGSVGDPENQLLYVASGTAGLTVIDLANPSGIINDDGDDVDDRVLGAVGLSGDFAMRAARYVDAAGRQIVAVAAGTAGVYLYQVAPAVAGLTLFDTNNIEIVPADLKLSDGTFVLVNDDNDDGDADPQGNPILDMNEAGPVKGENDLRRIDVSTPMTQGTVTIKIETGAQRAALWMTAEKGTAVPTTYDLSLGQHPPTTIWLEALSPSQADRDIVVLYRWTPPASLAMAPIEDRVALTAVNLQFITSLHGQPPASGVQRRQLFQVATTDDIETLLDDPRPPQELDKLSREMFARVQVAGVDVQSIADVSVHTAKGSPPDVGAIGDASEPTGATAFTMLPAGPRESRSQQDAAFYQGTPQGLAPPDLRQKLVGQGVLPVNAAAPHLADLSTGITATLTTASGLRKAIRRDPGKLAVLQVIDAQEFAAEIVAFKNTSDATALRATYAEKKIAVDDMDGALADGSSRLILRFELPREDPRQQLTFRVETLEPAPVGTHSTADAGYPFGSVTLTGVDLSTRSDHVTVQGITTSDKRRVFVAAYAPPLSFPYVDSPAGAQKTLPLRFSVSPSGQIDALADRPDAQLARPPVMFVHGLFGSPASWSKNDFRAQFNAGKFDISDKDNFVDYEATNVSGYDANWRALHQKFIERVAAYRKGSAVDKKHIAATRVDVVAHSMGGVLARWLASDDMVVSGGGIRSVHDADGSTIGTNFPVLNTSRGATERYQRQNNFMEGDMRSLVTIGSPLGGSPFGNWLLRVAMKADRMSFGRPDPSSTVIDEIQKEVGVMSQGKAPTSGNDVGTAILDLAIGSTAHFTLDSAPVPVRLHNIATNVSVLGAAPFGTLETLLLQLTAWTAGPSVSHYCQGFGIGTSDGIVPVASAFYGTSAGSSGWPWSSALGPAQSLLSGYFHTDQPSSATIAKGIAKELLYDTAQPSGAYSVNSFEPSLAQKAVSFTCP